MKFVAIRAIAMTGALLFAATVAAEPPLACPKQMADKPEVDPLTGKETPAGREARLELEMVVNVLVMYQGCSQDVPEFVAAYAADYRNWRAKYRQALARYEANAHARRYVECGLEHERRRAAADNAAGKADKKQACLTMGSNIEHIVREGFK